MNFDVTRLKLGVLHVRRTQFDTAFNSHNSFLPERRGLVDRFLGGPPGVERNLHDTCSITEIEKDQSTEIPGPVNPPRKRDLRPGVGRSERACLM